MANCMSSKIALIAGIFVIAVLALLFGPNLLWRVEFSRIAFEPGSSESAKHATATVYAHYYGHFLTGDYWEEELLHQTKELSESDRVQLYVEIIKRCELDGGDFLMVWDLATADGAAVSAQLQNLLMPPRLSQLPTQAQERVRNFSARLKLHLN